MSIQSKIRTIPNYPQPGVFFRDITTLLKDPSGFKSVIDNLTTHCQTLNVSKIAAIEARGFIIGAPLAAALGVGFVPVRKVGKLPGKTIGLNYELEYGNSRIEIHEDAIELEERILLVDDLIATGGTAQAACKLIKTMGGIIVECCFVIDLPDLGGRVKLESAGHHVFALCEFKGS